MKRGRPGEWHVPGTTVVKSAKSYNISRYTYIGIDRYHPRRELMIYPPFEKVGTHNRGLQHYYII